MGRKGFLKEHPIWLHLILAVSASIVIVIFTFIVLNMYGRTGQEYRTPYVVGSYFNELNNDDGLNLQYVIIDSVYQPNHRGGYIIKQDPDSGSLIKKGRKIYITVASYFPDNAIVPDLRSLSVRHAITQLENVGLHGGKLIFKDDPHHAVLEQRYKGRAVAEGRRLEKGAMIDLVVGRGTGNNHTIVPYTIGLSPTKARRDILSSSLNVGREHYDGISDMSRAIVYRQSPAYTGRSTAEYGSTVELWYCDRSILSMEEKERMRLRHIEDSIRSANIELEDGESDSRYHMIEMDEF